MRVQFQSWKRNARSRRATTIRRMQIARKTMRKEKLGGEVGEKIDSREGGRLSKWLQRDCEGTIKVLSSWMRFALDYNDNDDGHSRLRTRASMNRGFV